MVRPGLRPYLFMLSGCVWFAWMGLLTHALKDALDWQAVAVARSALATLFASIVAIVYRVPLVFLRPRMLWIRSVAGSCSMVATFYALTHMLVSDVLTLTNTFPVWVAILSWPLAAERPTLGVWIAVLCAVVGVAVAQQPDTAGLTYAAWAALFASICTAVAMLGLNRLKGVSAVAVVVHFSAVSTLFGLMAFFAFERPIGVDRLAETAVLIRMIGVGVTATIGQFFLTMAFRTGSATKVSVVTLSQVVMVMVAEATLDGRSFGLAAILGTTLVLGPTAWLMTRERRLAKPPEPDELPVEEVAIE